MSHYDILGVPNTAEYAEIRSKYRAAILSLHPDKFGGTGNGVAAADSHDVAPSFSNEFADDTTPQAKFISNIKESVGKMVDYVSGGEFQSQEAGEDVLDRFLDVQNAWEVLRDPESRANYDSVLRAERLAQEINSRVESSVVVGEEIYFAEMDSSHADFDNDLEFSYPCRCGDFFVVSKEELHEAGFADMEFDQESHATTSQNERQSCDSKAGGQEHGYDKSTGTRASRHTEHQFPRNSLLLPCQSCSLNLRVQFRYNLSAAGSPTVHH